MSRRITTDIACTLANALVNHRYKKEWEALAKHEHALATQVYNALYTPAERAQLDALPAGWAATSSSFYLTVGNGQYKLRPAFPVPVPAMDQRVNHRLKGNSAKNAALEEAVKQAYQDRNRIGHSGDYKGEARVLWTKTYNTIRSFSTIKRLVEAWPEIVPFIKANGLDDDVQNLPAVIPASLNKELALAA